MFKKRLNIYHLNHYLDNKERLPKKFVKDIKVKKVQQNFFMKKQQQNSRERYKNLPENQCKIWLIISKIITKWEEIPLLRLWEAIFVEKTCFFLRVKLLYETSFSIFLKHLLDRLNQQSFWFLRNFFYFTLNQQSSQSMIFFIKVFYFSLRQN